MSIQYLGHVIMVRFDPPHKPLIWLKNHPDPSPRLARWLVRMFDFEIEYREGNKNGNADAMSRWLLKPSEEMRTS